MQLKKQQTLIVQCHAYVLDGKEVKNDIAIHGNYHKKADYCHTPSSSSVIIKAFR